MKPTKEQRDFQKSAEKNSRDTVAYLKRKIHQYVAIVSDIALGSHLDEKTNELRIAFKMKAYEESLREAEE